MKPRFAVHWLITRVGFSILTAGRSFPDDNTNQSHSEIKVLILPG
jgi:hypothetical protein